MKRTASSTRWLNAHFNDYYVKQAKKEGYRSRAAFKLLELNERDHLLKQGMTVVDLGAAPGGWSAIAKQKIGDKGCLFALDILSMAPLAGVEFLQGDFNQESVVDALRERIDSRPIDLVMSDMSPNITGISAIDQPKAFQLAEQALAFAEHMLKPGGNFLVKVFQGQGFDAFLKAVRSNFLKVSIRKPKSSKEHSTEVYIVGMHLKSGDKS
jgi:23S rRNA (uridine2552-2'-O)-methyltransferase